ncbi:MAG: hypothetical protein K0S32_1807 [Bacteroidetes bacterium]|nr:hypothetical protein [Bacteroidota bacterium]
MEYTLDETVLAAALLHDVLEDTPVTAEELTSFLTPLFGEQKTKRTMELVTDLTDIYTKKNYPDWNRRKRKKMEVERLSVISSDAQTIKCADVLDNVNDIVLDDRDFAGVFLKECKLILEALNQSNPELHKRAMRAVENNLRILRKQS